MSGVPTSLEHVTGVTSFQPGPGCPWGAGGTSGTAAAVPVPPAQPPCPSWALCAPHGCWAPGEARTGHLELLTTAGAHLPSGSSHGSTWARRMGRRRRRRRKAALSSLVPAVQARPAPSLHLPCLNYECFVPWDSFWGWGWVWEGRAQPGDRFPSRGAELTAGIASVPPAVPQDLQAPAESGRAQNLL